MCVFKAYYKIKRILFAYIYKQKKHNFLQEDGIRRQVEVERIKGRSICYSLKIYGKKLYLSWFFLP